MSLRPILAKVARAGVQFFRGGFQGKGGKALPRNEQPSLNQQQQQRAWIRADQNHPATHLNKAVNPNYLNRGYGLKTWAAELRRQAAWRLSGSLYGTGARQIGNAVRSRGSLYAFVALGLAYNISEDDSYRYAGLTDEIKGLFKVKATNDENPPEDQAQACQDYKIGSMIGKGCNAAVYEARRKTDEEVEVTEDEVCDGEEEDLEEEDEGTGDEEDWEMLDVDAASQDAEGEQEEEEDVMSTDSDLSDGGESSVLEETESEVKGTSGASKNDLAIKVMFNYDDSNAMHIWNNMESETLPAQSFALHGNTWQNGHRAKKKRLKPHPNIVEMMEVFIDDFPDLPGGATEFPEAQPVHLNPDGYGRSKTMFLVMKRYDMTLNQYLQTHLDRSWRTNAVLLTQLVEAVAHLVDEGVSHRDLKSNNILLKLSSGDTPHLVLSDFGCCLADDNEDSLLLAFPHRQVFRGGNGCLMAPEILTTEPGPHCYLDYRKADLWAAGAIAYEIFGSRNPFYGNLITSANYNENQLPSLPDSIPDVIKKVIRLMLTKDPSKRPSAAVCATMLQIILFGPSDWFNRNSRPGNVDIMRWLLLLMAEVILSRSRSNTPEVMLKRAFLRRVDFQTVLVAVELLFE